MNWFKLLQSRLPRRMPQPIAAVLPGTGWTEHDRAKQFIEQENWTAALAASQAAIAIDANCPWFWNVQAEAQTGLGQWQEALASCDRAIALSPESWFYHSQGKAWLGLENYPAAIAAQRQAVTLDPTVSWFQHSLGEALLKQGEWQAAIAPLQRAIQLQPDYVWSYFHLGEALLLTRQVEAAIEVYQQAIAQYPAIDYLQHSLAYAQHLAVQEAKIQTYRQALIDRPPAPDRRKILMLMPYPPYPPKLGAIARMFHELKALSAKHHVVVVSFMFLKSDFCLEAELEQFCDLSLMVMIGDAPPRSPHQPKLIHRYSSQRFTDLLQQLQPIGFDLLSCNFIYMAQYQPLFPQAYSVLSEHNIESNLLRRCAEVTQNTTVSQMATQIEAVNAFVNAETEADLLAAYEDEYWQKFQLRTVVSELDKQDLDRRCATGKTIVVNNGIDLETVSLLPENHSKTVLLIGTLSYYPNIDGALYFAEAILPLIWEQDPEVQFWIAGAEPPAAVRNLAEPRIRVIANPEDMSTIAQSCLLTVVPLRIGSGTRIKIIHSMAMGLPVVSTSLGCEGLQVEDGKHLLIRDRPSDFAQAVLLLMQDRSQYHQMRQAGRSLVEQHYNWSAIFATAVGAIVGAYQSWEQTRDTRNITQAASEEV